MMWKWLLVVGLLNGIAWSGSVWGVGINNCGSVISELETLKNGEKHLTWTHGQWVLGYLSGVSVMNPKLGPKLEVLDSEGINLWIIKYCRENPLKDLATATTVMIHEATFGKDKRE